jgi:hypothetical protein
MDNPGGIKPIFGLICSDGFVQGEMNGWVCATCGTSLKKEMLKFECSRCMTEAVIRKDPEDYTKNFGPFVKGECLRCSIAHTDLRALSTCHSSLIRKTSASKITESTISPSIQSITYAFASMGQHSRHDSPKNVFKRRSSLFPELWAPEARPVEKLCKQICSSWQSIQELEKTRVASDIDLDECDDEGNTPLYYAITRGKLEIVDWLLSCGASTDLAVDKKVPLQIAMELEQFDIVLSLIAKLANPKLIDPNVIPRMPRCIRYLLDRASKSRMLRPDPRKLSILRSLSLEPLPSLDLSLVGQRYASFELNRILPTYKLRKENDPNHKQPLVLLFAGPNSHGKREMSRELARKLYHSPSKYASVQMPAIKDISQIFSTPCGFGTEEAPALGSLLANPGAKEALVFLEDIDKSSQDVLRSLQTLCETGEYRDPRTQKGYNCSRVIFILSSTAFDSLITEFNTAHNTAIHQNLAIESYEVLQPLQASLRKVVEQQFGERFTFNIEEIIPFLPFCSRDVRVLADFLLQKRKMKFAKKLTDQEFRCEEIFLEVCGSAPSDVIAKEYKDSLGALSLERALDKLVTQAVHEMFIEGKVKRGDRLFVFEQADKICISCALPSNFHLNPPLIIVKKTDSDASIAESAASEKMITVSQLDDFGRKT